MKRNITTILIIVVCLLTALPTVAQHVSYRSTAHYNKRVDQFEQEGGIDSTSIVMLGNSLTENAKDWAQRIGTKKHIVNRGIIGDNTTGMTERLCQITPHHPRAIFLMAGINDMAGGTSSTEVASRVIALIEQIRQQSPETVLFVQSILPINESNGRWKTLTDRTDDIPYANMLIRAYCQSNDIMYVDIFSRMTRGRSNELRQDLSADGLHLTEQGYKIWAFELKKYVKRL
ncbi:MAG: serine acetyltransferase [Prevotella sp.]|jgi:lysophospholipase L1-like esterase|nr:serine acetyltransferase [Prevotella sp.]